MKNDLHIDQIKKIWLLDLIVKSGSLKSAAAKAKISPSAVSQSLAALEKNVGKSLVIRERGTVLPTEDALSLLAAVRPAFEVFDRLNERIHHPVPALSWLNFGTYESLAVEILPGLIHSLREKMPGLKLGIRINRTGQLLTMVRKGELCSALITEVDDLSRLYAIAVGEDRLGLYVSARHGSMSAAKAIEKLGLGSLSPSKDGLPRYYTRFLKRLGTAKPSILSESFETLRAATASGAIASVLPKRVAMRSSDLIEIPTDGTSRDDGTHQIYVVSQTNCDRDEADFLAAESRRLLSRTI